MNVSLGVPKIGIINTTFHSQISIVITLTLFSLEFFCPCSWGQSLFILFLLVPSLCSPSFKVKMSGKQMLGTVLMGHSTINVTMLVGGFH